MGRAKGVFGTAGVTDEMGFDLKGVSNLPGVSEYSPWPGSRISSRALAVRDCHSGTRVVCRSS